jgi:hypothetical protein
MFTSAILDIGADTGALVIYADPVMLGREIEISCIGDLVPVAHNVVRARSTPGGFVYAAVFPEVTCGEYSVLRGDGVRGSDVAVFGGRVSEVDCREAPLSH